MNLDSYVQRGREALQSPRARDFVDKALKQSAGSHPAWKHLEAFDFRYVDADGQVSYGLRFDDVIVMADGSVLRIREVLAQQWRVAQTDLVAAVWSCVDCTDLINLLDELKVVVRLSVGVNGVPSAHMISAAYSAFLIRRLQAGFTDTAGGERVIDSLTRTLGIRAKVWSLTKPGRMAGQEMPTRAMRRVRNWLDGRSSVRRSATTE